MNGDKMSSSWSRCANEFADSSITMNDEKEVYFKKFSTKSRLPSSRMGLVATDIALANIKEIEKNELITEWIENGICTPPNSELNTSCASSPIFLSLEKAPAKSPVIKCSRKTLTHTKKSYKSTCFIDLTKSPIIGKQRRSSIGKKGRANSSGKLSLDESLCSTNSKKSPVLGKAHYSCGRKPKTKRRKLQYQSGLDNDSLRESNSGKKEERRSDDREKESSRAEESIKTSNSEITKKITQKLDNIEMSQDIFSEEIITATPLEGTQAFIGDAYPELLPIKKEEEEEKEEELFCSYEEVEKQLKNEGEFREGHSKLSYQTYEYSLSPVIDCGTKLARKLDFDFIQVKEQSFGSTIQDTEDFLLPERRVRNHLDSSVSKQTNDQFVILDSEFGVKKRKFVTDTERIDYDSNSETEEDNRDLKIEKTILGVESDSDKTVSDIIEEPITQDYAEAAKSEEILHSESQLASFLTSANSKKISNLTSPKNSCEDQVSAVDISVETTPPRTPESLVPAPELLDSGKKKKSRPKKGSLGARLQKLISGQVSSVRLWRHQMSRESAFERSSAPCSTLLVLDTWMQYGKNLYKSKVIDDPYDLLNDCLDNFNSSRLRDENVDRNLVIMTNPDFIGSVKLVPGNFFRIYLPWEVFNRNSGPGNIILHALYFNVIPNPLKTDLKLNSNESQLTESSNSNVRKTEIIREYDCPCLQNAKIYDSCLNKFTNHKVDVIAEIIK